MHASLVVQGGHRLSGALEKGKWVLNQYEVGKEWSPHIHVLLSTCSKPNKD